MAMARWRPFLIVLQASAAPSAGAPPEGKLKEVLDGVDAALGSAEGWRDLLDKQPKEECLPRP